MDKIDKTSFTARSKLSRTLLVLISVYAALYAAALIGYLFEPKAFSEISYEGIIVFLALILFLIGFYISWKNERTAGIIFIIWWGIMWYLGLFIAETDKGAGVVIGFPVFVIGVLFLVSWYKSKD